MNACGMLYVCLMHACMSRLQPLFSFQEAVMSQPHTHTHMFTFIRACAHTLTYTHTQTYMYTNTHTYLNGTIGHVCDTDFDTPSSCIENNRLLAHHHAAWMASVRHALRVYVCAYVFVYMHTQCALSPPLRFQVGQHQARLCVCAHACVCMNIHMYACMRACILVRHS